MLIDLLIPAALAQDAAAAMPAPSPLGGLLPLVFVFGIFYFLIIRPQQKKMKQHQATLKAIKRGDQIITGGGVHGKVTKVDEGGTLKVQIAEGVEITVEQSTVSSVILPPETDAKEAGKKVKAANDNA